MPNTTSAKKRLRQNIVRRDQNRAAKSALRTQLRKVREAIASGDTAKAAHLEQELKDLDQAGSRRIIHPNKASRLKSRLQHAIRKVKQAS